MNAPFQLTPRIVPTTEKPDFLQAMAIAKQMREPTKADVAAWAAAMKRALA